jgi:Fic family protein
MKGEAIHQEELQRCNVDDIKKGITCDNVEKLLDVSNATARKYLNELEVENKIKQIGERGRDVYYILNN